MLFNNYRPISLLPFFSKLFERLLYNRLIDFIVKHRRLHQYQFGFRKIHSTFMAPVTLLESITSALDNLEFSICVLIDFRKAFDTVGHSILLDKLHHYGIRGTALQWFNSYLTNIYQYVNYNNTTSNMKPIVCGVPQGSILGPLLFYYTYMIFPQCQMFSLPYYLLMILRYSIAQTIYRNYLQQWIMNLAISCSG